MTHEPVVVARSTVRASLVAHAYTLGTRRGVRDVGVDEIVSRSGVAKASLYRHFASKTERVRACLVEREQRWTQ
ncbi:TetR/AcrR family transcriptional regulator [Salinifilum ghardaiensis]